MTAPSDRPQKTDGRGVLVSVNVARAGALWARDPALAWETLEQFHNLLQTLLDDHGGTLQDPVGDTLVIGFDDAAMALMWCVRMQEGMVATEWPEALGPPEVPPGAGGVGQDLLFTGLLGAMAVHDGALESLLALAQCTYPGQVIISESTYDTLSAPLPPEIHARPLGDVGTPSGPVAVLQVLSRMLSRRRFPPLARRAPDLETSPTWFIGRSAELADLNERFEAGARLVFLHGGEAVGKSRLAQVYAAQQGDRFPGGVWRCDLSGTHDETDLVVAVAHALGLSLGRASAGDLVDRIGHAINSRGQILVLLDGFDSHDGRALGDWVRSATDTRFLVTGRTPLESDLATHMNLGPLQAQDARALLLARAFRHGNDMPAEADIEAALTSAGGFPFKLNSAAAELMGGTAQSQNVTVPTHDLRKTASDPEVEPDERIAAVLGAAPNLRRMGLLDVELGLFADTKSILSKASNSTLVARWHGAHVDVLQAIGDIKAATKAVSAGKKATSKDTSSDIDKAHVQLSAARLEASQDNHQAAIDAVKAVGELPAAQEPLQGQLHAVAGAALRQLGERDQAVTALRVAVKALRSLPAEQAQSMCQLARLRFEQGQTEGAVDMLQEALDLAQHACAPRTAATILGHLAQLARFVEAREDAIERCRAQVELLRGCGDRVGQAESQLKWARLALSDMDAESAIIQLESALAIAREGGMKALEAQVLAHLGIALRISGDLGTALDSLAEAAALAEDDATLAGFIHAHRGAVEAAWDRIDVAEEAFAQAQAHLEESGDALYSTALDVLTGFVDVARGRDAAIQEDERSHGEHVERALNRLARGSSFETRSMPPRGEETAWRLADLRVARLLLDAALSALIPDEGFSG